jgi:lysophospholipase L1-like esterase
MHLRILVVVTVATLGLCDCGNSSSVDMAESAGAGGWVFGPGGSYGTSSSGGSAGSGGAGVSGWSGAGSGGIGASAGTSAAGSSGAAASGGSAGATGTGGSSGTLGASGSGGTVFSAGGNAGNGGVGGAGANASSSGGAAMGGTSGAAGSAGASGAGGSGGGYQPCPTDGAPCKILPLGDSITWGVGDEGNAGYRGPFFALAVAAKQNITFTGSLSNGPNTVSGQPFPKRNEGHSGWTISTPNAASGSVPGISALIPSPAFDSGNGGSPHVILLMIGTNDVGNSTGAQIADRLKMLIDKITGAAPNALIVVAKITPVSWASSVVNAYNDAIPGVVQSGVAAGKHLLVADMNTGFDSATMLSSDNLHPNSTGYKFMASRWYAVVGSLFPQR